MNFLSSPIKAFSLFILFFLFNFLLGALLAYPIALILSRPIDQVMPIVIQLGLVLTFYPFLRLMQLNNLKLLGFNQSKQASMRSITKGFIIGVAIMLLIVIALTTLQIRTVNDTDHFYFHIFRLLILGGISGLLIGLIEETFFRGAMVSAMIRSEANLLTIVLSTSLFFAALHFLDPLAIQIPLEQTHWYSGLIILAGAFHKFSQPEIYGTFLALTAAGAFLTLIRLHQGHILICIGIHAGWVFVIKYSKHFTSTNDQHEWRFLAGYYDGITGYLAFMIIGLISLIYAYKVFYTHRRSNFSI